VIAVSGGGWGVGDLVGATRAALAVPDALVLTLCGRNDKTRARVAGIFGAEPRLRLMGFTDRMGDVLAASDALIHSSAGLTVLEALIRGCPVISYGFGYGHVRESNAALVRFGLAQVARNEKELGPALDTALESRPEPDSSFARRPSTASLILNADRRARQLPRWRLRTARAVTAMAALVAVAAWTLTAGASYDLVSTFVHMHPLTNVATDRPEVGLLVDSRPTDLPAAAETIFSDGLHASFALASAKGPVTPALAALPGGDQAIPRLGGGGLVRWIETGDQLHRVLGADGQHHDFLYASSGPSVGQWLVAHGDGGRLIGGQVKLTKPSDAVGRLHAGEVVEITVTNISQLQPMLTKLYAALRADHLRGVSVGRLLRDAGFTI
jgi:Glycosyl transferases group 1